MGDSYDTPCTGVANVYYCAEPIAKTGASAKIEKAGFVTKSASYTDRTGDGDSQSQVTISNVLYTVKVNVVDVASNPVTGATAAITGGLTAIDGGTNDADATANGIIYIAQDPSGLGGGPHTITVSKATYINYSNSTETISSSSQTVYNALLFNPTIDSINPTEGNINSSVLNSTAIIIVHGFSPNSELIVKFNNTIANINGANTTNSTGGAILNVTVPVVSVGVYDINVTDENGHSAVSNAAFTVIDGIPPVIWDISLNETDTFVSSTAPNNVITVIINASDHGYGADGIKFITVNFSALNQPGIGLINATSLGGGLFNATITVTDVSSFEFNVLNITVFGADNSDNLAVGQSVRPVILYNFTRPSFFGNPCYQWGDATTDLTKETDFEHVNYVLELKANISCMMGGLPEGSPAWMSQFETVAMFNFSSINMSDPTTGPKLGMLLSNMEVNITLPGEFGDSRIYFNTTYLSEFNTNATVKLFHLPFVSQPNIQKDVGAAGYDNTSIVWVQGVGEGNLTFAVYGFSGYNITDNVAPNITFNAPLYPTNDTTPTINITLNGTKTTISYLLVQIDNTSYVFNSTVNQTNCQATADPEIMNCVFESGNLSNGNHNVFILARDFGGASGNTANLTQIINIDTVAPVVNITSPATNSIQGEAITIHITVSEDADTNISVYNSTGALVNSTMIIDEKSIITSLSVPAEDVYSIVATSRDTAGNYGNATVTNITVDMTNPVVVITSPANDTEFDSATITISGNSTDDHLNYTNISIHKDEQLISSTTTTNTTWSVKLAVNASLSGYYITVKAFDLAGNYGNETVTNISVNDTVAPNVTAISATTSGSTVTLSVTTNEFAVCRYATSDIAYENMSNMTTTGGLTHSISITYSSTTSGTYYVRCADPIGNVMNESNSTSFSVTISSGGSSSTTTTNQTTNVTPYIPLVTPPLIQPQPEETPAPTTPVSVVASTASTAVFSLNAAVGEQVTIDIAKLASGVAQGTGISKISIATRSSVSNVQVSIKPVERPSSIQEPSKKVLNYIEINFGAASDAVQSAKITFTLKKSEISKQNVDADTIKLLRYANGQWQELQTVKGFEDVDSITFEATTPGFSYFAITGDEIQAPAETPKITTTTGGEEEPEIVVVSEKKEESPLGLILLVAVILIIGYIVLSSQKPWKTE